MDTSGQDFTTGNTPTPTPILANAAELTADGSKPAQAPNAPASITVADLLALLQTDCSDLQSAGCKVAILAANHKIYIAIEYPGHELSAGTDGTIYINGKDVKTL